MDTISKMRAALAEAAEFWSPVREYRLHPDDYKALCEQCAPFLQYDAAPASADSFAGVRIIQDEGAERLPRLKTPNASLSGGRRPSA